MPSTEFLLYLVTVIFVVYLIMNYYKDNSNSDDNTKYRYLPIYTDKGEDNNSSENGSFHTDGQASMMNGNQCNNPMCLRTGRCICGGNKLHININNQEQYPHGAYGHRGPGPGPGPGIGPGPPPIDPLRKFDYDAVHDEFTPPFRRSYYDDHSSYALHPALYPTYSRGPPGRFRKTGTLVAQGVSSSDKYKFMNMIGREKYPGREYEYYASSTNTESRVKFYIETKGREIHDGDMVTIPELEGYTFRYKEDPDLSPKYDPYFIY